MMRRNLALTLLALLPALACWPCPALAKEVIEAWRSPFGVARSVSVNPTAAVKRDRNQGFFCKVLLVAVRQAANLESESGRRCDGRCLPAMDAHSGHTPRAPAFEGMIPAWRRWRRLRGLGKAVGGDSRGGEETTFDMGRNALGGAIWFLPLLAGVNERRERAPYRGMRSPVIVILLELGQHHRQMSQFSDERHPTEPFMFEAPDQALGDRDGTVPVHRAEALSHLPLRQQLSECPTGEHRFLVGDQMSGSTVAAEGLLQCLNHPARIGALKWTQRHHLAGIVIDRRDHLRGPDAPPPYPGAIHRPEVIWVPSHDLAWLGVLCRLGSSTGCAFVPGARPQQDVAHRGGCQEDAQRAQCERDATSPPMWVGRGDLPHEPRQRFRGPVDAGSTSLTTEPNAVLESA